MQYRFFLLLVLLNGSLVFPQTPLPVAEVGTRYRVQIAWPVASATCPCSVSYETHGITGTALGWVAVIGGLGVFLVVYLLSRKPQVVPAKEQAKSASTQS